MPRAIKTADLVVADSESTANDIIEEFPDDEHKIRVVHPGLTSFFTSHQNDTLGKFRIHAPYFLFVGTIEPRKNLDRLLQAFASLSEAKRKGFKLVIAGGKGWGNVNPQLRAAKLGLQKDIIFTGYVSDGELHELYAQAQFLIMPSLYEGFGFPIIEAMSYGVPVITSNLSSMPEVAGDAAILIDPYEVTSIAAALQALIQDKTLRNRLGLKAKKQARNFSWNTAAKRMWNVFLEARELKQKKFR